MQEGISGKIGTFHQLKTNDFDDGGLDDHWGLQFFLIPREEEPQIIVPMADVRLSRSEPYRGRKPWRNLGENHLKY
jgi:hypothetical protein